jgi:hypothetical protein
MLAEFSITKRNAIFSGTQCFRVNSCSIFLVFIILFHISFLVTFAGNQNVKLSFVCHLADVGDILKLCSSKGYDDFSLHDKFRNLKKNTLKDLVCCTHKNEPSF